jgi:uncharacterized membrane protein
VIGALNLVVLAAHVASAVGLIVGIVGRNALLAHARRAGDIAALSRRMHICGYFERLLVIPGSQVILVTGLVLAWMRGWPILGTLQGGAVNWVLAALILYLSTIPLVVWVFLPRGKIFERALADAQARGAITGELSRAMRDRAVELAHNVEYVLVAAVMYLMLAKPF